MFVWLWVWWSCLAPWVWRFGFEPLGMGNIEHRAFDERTLLAVYGARWGKISTILTHHFNAGELLELSEIRDESIQVHDGLSADISGVAKYAALHKGGFVA